MSKDSNFEKIEKKPSISERAELLRTSYDKSSKKISIPPGFEEQGPKYQFYSTIVSKNEIKKKFPQDIVASEKRYSAGILPFAIKNTSIYVLLGRDVPHPESNKSNNANDEVGSWSDFGGRSEISDNGRWDYTAAREFYEETIGSIMDISTMISKLSNKKNYIKIKSITLNGFPYYMYLLKIPYKDYRQNFQGTLSFIKYINDSTKLDYKYFEKTDIQWISLDTLLESTRDETLYPLRPVFKKTISANIEIIKEFCTLALRANVFDN